MHSQAVLHIKESNVLLKRNEGALSAVLADFGLCGYSLTGRYVTRSERITTNYRPPECWFDEYTSGYAEYSAKADVYSFGVVAYRLFSGGEYPVEASGLTMDNIDRAISEIPSRLGAALKGARFVASCCSVH